MENRFLGLGKRDLKDVQLRLLNELANLRTDSRRARQRLTDTRSSMAEVKFQLAQVERALQALSILQFPSQIVVPQPEMSVSPAEEITRRRANGKA